MKYRNITAIIMIFAVILSGCAAKEPAVTEADTDADTTEASSLEIGSSEEIPESSVIIETWPETEEETGEYVIDGTAAEWFAEILSEWVKGGDGSVSDEAKVGSALYELYDGEINEDMIFDASVEDWSSVRAQGATEAHIYAGSIYKMLGDSKSADDSGAFGKNSAVQSLDGAYLEILNSKITAGAKYATGITAYNKGVVCIADSDVNVSGTESGGILAAAGGKLYAWNLNVSSEHSSAVIINGTGEFSMKGGSLEAVEGAVFSCTKAGGRIDLENVVIKSSADSGLLTVSDGSCTINIQMQKIEGDILSDDESSLEINMISSNYNGAVNPDGAAGSINMILDDTSTWTLAADSYISSFTGSIDNVDMAGHQLVVNGAIMK